MSHNSQSVEKFGRQIAEHVGEGPSTEERMAYKDAILRHSVAASKRSRSTNRSWRIGFVAAASIVVVLASISLWRMGPSPIEYWVGTELTASGAGRWVKALTDRPLQVRFENGNNLVLTSNSTMRIIKTDTEAISVALDSGQLTAQIKKGHGSTFSVKAGPYWIHDIGTVFSVAWSPERMALEVRVTEGLVRIAGGHLPERGVQVGAGDLYRYPANEGAAAPQPRAHLSIDPPVAESASSEKPEQHPSRPHTTARPAKINRQQGSLAAKQLPTAKKALAAAPEPAPPAWSVHLSHGEHAKAIRTAKDAGLGDVARQATDTELWKLSQAARYARDGQTAKRLLQYYRERFGHSSLSKTAAFLIGRVELELLDNPIAAANWFETYLNQAPNDHLAEEALGRLIQVHRRLGHVAETENTARRYLQKYPNGLYKKLASTILNE